MQLYTVVLDGYPYVHKLKLIVPFSYAIQFNAFNYDLLTQCLTEWVTNQAFLVFVEPEY
jgi:hypothetical protein